MIEYTNSDVEKAIAEHIHSARNREIIRRRLIDGMTFGELADEFHLSERQIKSIVYAAQKVVFRHA